MGNLQITQISTIAVPNPICYEQPLTKPIRLFIRFEQLMSQFAGHLQRTTPEDAHSAILTLLEIYQLTMHVDLKAEVMREIDRMSLAMKQHDNDLMARNLEMLQTGSQSVSAIRGQLGGHLKDHHFFNLVRQRMSMPGGINSFDLPIYHHWLAQSADDKKNMLTNWIQPYSEINRTIKEILIQVRKDCRSQQVTAEQGYYQQTFKINEHYQMLRVILPHSISAYPEVSSGRQRVSIRFFDPLDLGTRPGQSTETLEFELMYCGL
ncbi:MAG TPA: cell division protein ZapD [Gammaproteobacteria bacterium]|nr:cell division protein ZapD [Gammaproteobacteria bacterium]